MGCQAIVVRVVVPHAIQWTDLYKIFRFLDNGCKNIRCQPRRAKTDEKKLFNYFEARLNG